MTAQLRATLFYRSAEMPERKFPKGIEIFQMDGHVEGYCVFVYESPMVGICIVGDHIIIDLSDYRDPGDDLKLKNNLLTLEVTGRNFLLANSCLEIEASSPIAFESWQHFGLVADALAYIPELRFV